MGNIFQDSTKSLPKQDQQIVRVPMNESVISGRSDHLPGGSKSMDMGIQHVPNAGTKD